MQNFETNVIRWTNGLDNLIFPFGWQSIRQLY